MTDLKYLIDYKWHILRWWYRGYSILMWLMTLLMCVQFVWAEESILLMVINILLNIFFILFEVKCLMKDPLNYLSQNMNIMDSFVFTFDIIALIVGKIYDSQLVEYLITLCIVLLCLRAMTHLRIFDGTRYLIIMILQVFNNISSFLVIYGFFIFAYAIVWLKASQLNGIEQDYMQALAVTTNLAFGSWDTGEYTSN
jgi:Ion transport protein